MFNNSVTLGIVKPITGGSGEVPGLSDVLAVSNRELKYIEETEYYFEVGDETKELVLNGNVEEPINLLLVTENLPLETELIINAFKTSGFLGFGDDEVRYHYNGIIYQNGDDYIEIPLGAKCVIRNVVDEDEFFVTIQKIETSTIEPLYNILNAGDRTLNATFGDVLPVEETEITLYGNSKNDHIVFTDETLLNDLIVNISIDLHSENAGGVLKVTNASNHSVELRPIDGVTLLADTLFIPKNATAIIKYIYQNDGAGEYNIGTFTVTYEGNNIDTFSTNETVIGKWIDGKTLYRKVVNFDNPLDNDHIPFDLPEIDFILVKGSYTSGSLDKIQIPYFKDSSETGDRIVDMIYAYWTDSVGSDGGIRLVVNFYNYTTELPIYRTGSGYLIFEYTKTTD